MSNVELLEPLLSMQARRRRVVGLGVLGVVAFCVHLLAFSGLQWMWPADRSPMFAPVVHVRVVDRAAGNSKVVEAEPLPAPPDLMSTSKAQAVGTATVSALKPMPAVSRRHPAALLMPSVQPAAEALPTTPAATTSDVAPLQVVVTPGIDATAVVVIVPRYPTQLPPTMTLRYVLQRGALQGNGELSWRLEGDRYELRLEGRVAGLTVLRQVSSGGIDDAGLAPLRFTDQRLRRGTKAANFQREAGKITFSGPSVEFPMREGVQDRLSWMMQLSAIVAADPRLREVGAKIVIYVVGANGDASVWAFDCTAIESIAAGEGPVKALKFVRESREPYDTQVQIWIDSSRRFLPVRATQKSGPNDESFDLRLQSVEEKD